MGAYQVYPDLQFQRRLRKSSEVHRVEVYFFLKMLEQYGMAAVGVPRYSVPVAGGKLNAAGRMEFLLKIMGTWTSLWLEERQPGVLVVYDRSG
jgi:hypothetical protein